MHFLNLKNLSVLVFLLTFTINSSYLYAFNEDEEIESQVVKLLRKRDVGEMANELAREKQSGSIKNLLINLSVFARAGHRQRVFETLGEISKIYPSVENKWQVVQVVKRAIGKNDFPAQKIYYESFAVPGDDYSSNFTGIWRVKGDVGELEKWLNARKDQSETWWQEWVKLKKETGAADEVFDKLERQIRANPSDFYLIEKYLRTISYIVPLSVPVDVYAATSYERDISWLSEVVPTDTAYIAYELGKYLAKHNPAAALKLYQKSLSLPFTDKDLQMFGERAFRYASIKPVVRNPEKQTRFWTMTELAKVYKATGQAHLAQPIVEELTKMETSDIQASNQFQLAGQVQTVSGQRVVESKILQDEAEKENSLKYWFERIQYYTGRNEDELVWQTYQKALEKFPYKPNDYKNSILRLRILAVLSNYGAGFRETDAEVIFRRELTLANAQNDAPYLAYLGRTIADDFKDLFAEFFVNTELLPKVLANRKFWNKQDGYLIESVMEDKRWKAVKREAVWNRLAALARQNVKYRAYTLAVAMTDENEYPKAIPLLEAVLKVASKDYEDELDYSRDDVERELFGAYLEIYDWQKAEKLYFDGFEYWNDELAKIAFAAANSGKLNDALRLWKIQANLDRRNLRGLNGLAQTDAKPLLREFYLQMKKADSLTDATAAALEILK